MRLLENCRIVNGGRVSSPQGWILIDGERIVTVGEGSFDAASAPADLTVIDCGGAYAMPGMIDCHVHFREPGMTSKATIATESLAAVAGGVTSFMEMPNTLPSTTTVDLWQQKMDIAARDSHANYSFFIGATDDNMDSLLAADYSRVPGIKLFVGSSTGRLLVSDSHALECLFENAPALIAVHAEDEATLHEAREAVLASRRPETLLPEDHIALRPSHACLKATRMLVALARRYHSRLHVCHLSTADEVLDPGLFTSGAPEDKAITCEVAPAHLLWCREDYRRLGNMIKINPAVKEERDREALRRAVREDVIDIIATDHAPHMLAEKMRPSVLEAVSGAPMVQFALPMMLELFSPEKVVEKYAHNPAVVYGVEGRGRIEPGYYADIVLVDDRRDYPIADSDVKSLCGFTPLRGITPRHRVLATLVNGRIAFSAAREGLAPDEGATDLLFPRRRLCLDDLQAESARVHPLCFNRQR